ncbi:sensor histidine kinase [Pseudonocardia asaccharolytica]|uniref:Oxygen sensor histidine kinase NreB n=1 Tax=Pseudonocardia asaccharolytica DSM 44247 = NBRC 16224 TaxID=1123024 RepID=A0A511D178_9PSEU|nr:sensor histidine kinase [Pseudonocardia asaccharolytica]GEL18521.1 histidine kinase [Pseudonocardia asaccharolytica DSM 44247 = NBRC 16224]
MVGQRAEDRLDAVERRAEMIIDRFTPFLGLGLGLILTIVVLPSEGPRFWAVTGALVAATLAWTLLLAVLPPVRADEPRLGAVYMVGMLALTAALTWLSPLFAFLVLAVYGHAFRFLRGHWRFAAVAVAAAVAAYSQMGGRLAEPSPGWWAGLAALVVANMLVAGGFSWFFALSDQQTERRKQMIAELEETNARLAAALEENAGLHAQLLAQAREAGVHDERQRMAREIHDTLAQGLTGIVTQLEAAMAAGDDELRDRHVGLARGLARESLREARRSVEALRPEPLEAAQLPDALADLAHRWSEISGVAVRLDTTGVARALLPELEVTLFRVAQEALANVAKHAEATTVGLTLSYMDEVVVLDVRDDGIGFAPGERRGGFGLTAMEQRVRRVSGSCSIESAPGEGTALSVSVPAIPAEVQV